MSPDEFDAFGTESPGMPQDQDKVISNGTPPIPDMAKVRKRIPSIPLNSDVNRSTGSPQIPNVVSIPDMQINPQISIDTFDALGTESSGMPQDQDQVTSHGTPPIPEMAAKVRKRIPSIPSYSDVNRSTGSLQIPNVVSIPNMQNPQKSEPAFDVLGTDSPGILRKTRIREVAPEARSSRKKVSHSLSTSEVPAELFSGMIVLQSVPPQSLAALLQPALYKSSRRAEIVCLAHNDYMGHHGCRATTRMLRAYGYTWVGMHKDVEDFVKRCVTCQLNNYNTHPFKGKRYLLVASHPFERVTIDALGRLEGDDSYSYIAVKYVTCPGSSGYLRSSL